MKTRHRLPPQVCPVCKQKFIPVRKGTLYCSHTHTVAAHRARRAAEEKAEQERLNNPQLAMLFTVEDNDFTEADMRILRGGK